MSLLEQASLVITPNAFKESILYSVVPADGSGDMDVVRATTATRVNSEGLIEVVPRNLFTYSNDFADGSWGKQNCTITPNYANNPFGVQNASLIQDSVGTSTQYRVSKGVTAVNGIFNLSLYVKRLSGTKNAYIDISNQTAYFNFTDEVIVSGAGIVSFTKLDDGWYRINISNPTANSFPAIFLGFANVYNETYTSTGGNQMLFYASQLEASSTATEYFPTTTRLNIPRIDYTNGSCPSILVEPQRTNSLTYSEQFDNAIWTTNGLNVTVSANSTTAPDGTLLADKVIPLSTTSKYIFQNTQVTSGQSYTYSIFAKKGEYDFLQIVMDSTGFAGSTDWFNVDLTNGTFGNQIINSITDKSITSLTNGWYRITVTKVATSTTSSGRVILSPLNSNYNSRLPSYTSDETSGIFLWGAQFEAGSYATSYIPTVASSVTRNADVISKTGISGLIGQTEGTLFVDVIPVVNAPADIVALNLSTNNSISIGMNSTTIRATIFNSGNLFGITGGDYIKENRYKIALVYKNNNSKFFVNGVLKNTNISNLVFNGALNDLFNYSTNYYEGESALNYNSTQLYKTALTDQECINLTTL